MTRPIAWGPIMQAAARGDLELVQIGQTPATVARRHAGGRPVYLATPYSREVVDEDGAWDYARSVALMQAAAREATALMAHGVSAFSPIAQAATMVHAAGHRSGAERWCNVLDPLDSAAWMKWCQPSLNVCAAVVVPNLTGWDRSAGIWAEVSFAIERQMPVFVYANENDWSSQ